MVCLPFPQTNQLLNVPYKRTPGFIQEETLKCRISCDIENYFNTLSCFVQLILKNLFNSIL